MATLTMEEFQTKINRWIATQPEQLKIALKKSAEIVRGEAVSKHLSGPKMTTGVGSLKNATLQPRSGDLRGSVNTKVSVTKSKVSSKVATSLIYARIHEKGGTILPKKGKFLKFKIGNRTIFAKSVKIPKRPFLSPSLEAKRKTILDVIGDALIKGYEKS